MRRSIPPATLLALGVLVVAAGLHHQPLLACLESCVADLTALHGEAVGRAELADVRLNAWILAWVQHSLLTSPATLFDPNAFYPATNALAGSEHLIVPALLVLPVRLATSDPVALHQASTALSSLLLAFTSFALVRWTTGSALASLVAGSLAVFMPWRVAELAHVQLLNLQWLPLVWLLAARVLLGEGRFSAAGLAAALALQLLSSAYLAYYTLLSLVVLALVFAALERDARARLGPLLVALVVPLVLLVLVSLPYLARSQAGEAAPRPGSTLYSLGLSAWRFLVPHAGGPPGAAGGYAVPLPVAALAVAGLLAAFRRRDGELQRRQRLVAVALSAIGVACFLMMIGREAEIAGRSIPMPSAWAARIVPGFAFLGTPLRWGVVIGCAAPILAGLGIAALDGLVARSVAGRSRLALSAWRIAALALVALGVPWTQVPARAAWAEPNPVRAAHDALADLAPGPILEVPWPIQRVRAMELESRYMLASARHWRPILNGFTAYRPPSYALLRRVAQGLPDPQALRRLRALVDVRWIVVHEPLLPHRERPAWQAPAPERGGLRLVRELVGARIYEVADWERSVGPAAALFARGRSETLSGLPRTPLALPESAGRMEAELPEVLVARRLAPLQQIRVRITNATSTPWPAFGVGQEGLVRLRYVFTLEDGVAVEESAALDADLPPHTTTSLEPWIEMPAEPGRYRLRLELAQRVDGTLRPLPVPAVEHEVVLRAAAQPGRAP